MGFEPRTPGRGYKCADHATQHSQFRKTQNILEYILTPSGLVFFRGLWLRFVQTTHFTCGTSDKRNLKSCIHSNFKEKGKHCTLKFDQNYFCFLFLSSFFFISLSLYLFLSLFLPFLYFFLLSIIVSLFLSAQGLLTNITSYNNITV